MTGSPCVLMSPPSRPHLTFVVAQGSIGCRDHELSLLVRQENRDLRMKGLRDFSFGRIEERAEL